MPAPQAFLGVSSLKVGQLSIPYRRVKALENVEKPKLGNTVSSWMSWRGVSNSFSLSHSRLQLECMSLQLMAAMRGLIVIQEGASQIGKLRAPKTAAEVLSFIGRNGHIYDENEVGLIGSDSLEAGNYTFKQIDVPSIPAAKSPMTMETCKKLIEHAMAKVEDAMKEIVRDSMATSGIESLSMSSITTEVAEDVLKMAGFSVVDGSAVEPAKEVSDSKDWEFDMGQYAREEDCYEPFFNHMVKYLNTVHAVNIQKDPPSLGAGYCRLLDVHDSNEGLGLEADLGMELEAELGDRTLRITGNLDAVFVPRRCGLNQYKNSVLGGVEVKHPTAHKETFQYGALGQALIEALAVYAYSDLPKGIFLFTSYDDNAVLEWKDDGEMWCWTKLNFAQAMDKIAAFLKGEDVRKFLEDSENPATGETAYQRE